MSDPENSHLTVGSQVEVWTKEDGKSVWYPGTVLDSTATKTPSPKNNKRKRTKLPSASVRVQYLHMLSSEDQTKLLVEQVKASFIRPASPMDSEPLSPLEPLTIVDAFHDDVWYTGYVLRRIGDFYIVAFKNPPDVLQISRSNLRLHWDWDLETCSWSKPPKESEVHTGTKHFTLGMEIEQDFNEEAPGSSWLPAYFLGKAGRKGPHFLKYTYDGKRLHVHLHNIRPAPPKIPLNSFQLYDEVDARCGKLMWTLAVITEIHEGNNYTVMFEHDKVLAEFNVTELRPHLEWIRGRWVSKSKVVKKLIESVENEIGNGEDFAFTGDATIEAVPMEISTTNTENIDVEASDGPREETSIPNVKTIDVKASDTSTRNVENIKVNASDNPRQETSAPNVENIEGSDRHRPRKETSTQNVENINLKASNTSIQNVGNVKVKASDIPRQESSAPDFENIEGSDRPRKETSTHNVENMKVKASDIPRQESSAPDFENIEGSDRPRKETSTHNVENMKVKASDIPRQETSAPDVENTEESDRPRKETFTQNVENIKVKASDSPLQKNSAPYEEIEASDKPRQKTSTPDVERNDVETSDRRRQKRVNITEVETSDSSRQEAFSPIVKNADVKLSDTSTRNVDYVDVKASDRSTQEAGNIKAKTSDKPRQKTSTRNTENIDVKASDTSTREVENLKVEASDKPRQKTLARKMENIDVKASDRPRRTRTKSACMKRTSQKEDHEALKETFEQGQESVISPVGVQQHVESDSIEISLQVDAESELENLESELKVMERVIQEVTEEKAIKEQEVKMRIQEISELHSKIIRTSLEAQTLRADILVRRTHLAKG